MGTRYRAFIRRGRTDRHAVPGRECCLDFESSSAGISAGRIGDPREIHPGGLFPWASRLLPETDTRTARTASRAVKTLEDSKVDMCIETRTQAVHQ
ncbi:hypothetical protein KM043_005718 [Ampulex compressa]|nr:hypothetical protein KM043_005718 [Ampulex compressa]